VFVVEPTMSLDPGGVVARGGDRTTSGEAPTLLSNHTKAKCLRMAEGKGRSA